MPWRRLIDSANPVKKFNMCFYLIFLKSHNTRASLFTDKLYRLIGVAIISFLFLPPLIAQSQTNKNSTYVNPFIGVDQPGRVHPAATLPYSMVSLGPDCVYPQSTAGYWSNTPIIGFSHVRLSGTGGGGRYGNFLVTPITGDIDLGHKESTVTNETAKPGFYGCTLEKYKVDVRLTLTERTGFHEYTFTEGNIGTLLLDVSSTRLTLSKSTCIASDVTINKDGSISGSGTYIGGYGSREPYKLYFYARFEKPFAEAGTWKDNKLSTSLAESASDKSKGVNVGAFFKFPLNTSDRKVKLKLAISHTSISNANKHFEQSPGWNFDTFKDNAALKWDKFLDRISVKGGTEKQRSLFYTSFYRTAMMPRDLTGDNPLWESGEPHFWEFYCFWDTFRTLNPLLTIIDPKKEADIIRCLIDIYEHTGWLPDCWTAGGHGSLQGGSNADVVLSEAIIKGLKGFDYERAYKALKNSAENTSNNPRGRFLKEYLKYGYLPTHDLFKYNNPSVGTSRTLEYAYNDFTIALAAKKLGKTADYEKYMKRSHNVMNVLFNDSLKLFWAKDSLGNWLPGFDKDYTSNRWSGEKYKSNWMGHIGPFYEGSPWTYSTFYLQNIHDLITKHGGQKNFIAFVDKIFESGYYEVDNEPAMHLPWLYIYAGEPHKTYERIRDVLDTHYKVARDGWPGNDDAGTVSSWYMFSTMGFYPIAGQSIYLFTTPAFTESKLTVGPNKYFTITAKGLSDKNTHIKSATLNNKPLDRAWLNHSEIAEGGRLVLTMSEKPSDWGKKNLPPVFK